MHFFRYLCSYILDPVVLSSCGDAAGAYDFWIQPLEDGLLGLSPTRMGGGFRNVYMMYMRYILLLFHLLIFMYTSV
jgi:hypothetical protein